jgi:Bacteriocin class II with double-glycine leader peptide
LPLSIGWADLTQQEKAMSELTMDELDTVNGGKFSLVTDKGYVGLEVSIAGYGFAVWATGGSVCGSVITPKNPTGTPGHCTP